MERTDGVVVSGVMLLSFGRACLNLSVVLGPEAEASLEGVAPNGWYFLERYSALCRLVAGRYERPGPILERIGAEMMRIWYELGPGRSIVKRPVDFLLFQTGSGGYESVVRGEPEAIGTFALESLSEEAGVAAVRSTTPMDRDVERGVLIGGLGLTGTLDYIEVDNSRDRDLFAIEFH